MAIDLLPSLSLHERLITQALHQGFISAGGVDLAHPDTALAMAPHYQHYRDWLGRGYVAEMAYLERGRLRREEVTQVFEAAQSVFCVLSPYRRTPVGKLDPTQGVRYARYLAGGDYHTEVAEQLEKVLEQVKRAATLPSLQWKVCVDTSAVLERSWAALAGLGWIGKNTLLIHPRHGSYHFIGVVLLNVALGAGPRPIANLCGHCERCLTACPTQAFAGPGWLDSRRCISYRTLEKRGELTLTPEDRKAQANWVAGCDVCQEVCPFNNKPTRAAQKIEPTQAQGAIAVDGWQDLLKESESQYRARVANSALKRIKYKDFKRNVAIASQDCMRPKRNP